MAIRVIEPGTGTAVEYRALAKLYMDTKDLSGWPGGAGGKLDVPRLRICGSQVAGVARFAIATRSRHLIVRSDTHGIELQADEECLAYIGPLQTLTQNQALAAIRESFVAWMDNAIARGAGARIFYGIAPEVWPSKLHNFFAPRVIGGVLTPAKWAINDFVLEDGEYWMPGKWHVYWQTFAAGRALL